MRFGGLNLEASAGYALRLQMVVLQFISIIDTLLRSFNSLAQAHKKQHPQQVRSILSFKDVHKLTSKISLYHFLMGGYINNCHWL
jgi:hypothetical protein